MIFSKYPANPFFNYVETLWDAGTLKKLLECE